jgi:DNA (cytosine-5)-methyltransferase 1
MLTPQHLLDLAPEIVVDLFAGGGGASTGMEQALGFAPHVAVNHDPEAIALHQANHPQTRHFISCCGPRPTASTFPRPKAASR